MRPYDLHFFPYPPIYLLGFFLILGFLLALLRLGIIRYVYERLGLSSGTLGTLLGADVLHLAHIRDLGAPVASIGGAGTFDGVFMIGIVSVLLAGIPGRPKEDSLTGRAEV